MLTTIIIDDEFKIREVLKNNLKYCSIEIEVLAEASNIIEAELLIRKHKPQFIFLDVSMPGGNGFDLLEKFTNPSFEVIFVTGYQEYAIEAIKAKAVDYLLKPVSYEDMDKALSRVVEKIEAKNMKDSFQLLKNKIQELPIQNSRVVLPGTTDIEFIEVSKIVRCEGWNKYTKVYVNNGECILSNSNIGVFVKLLSPYDFFSSHKSHLINVSFIKKYSKDGAIVMQDMSQVPLARRRKELFKSNVLGLNEKQL